MWDKIKTKLFNRVVGLDKEAMDKIKAKAVAKAEEPNQTILTDQHGHRVIFKGEPGQDITPEGIKAHITCMQDHIGNLKDEIKSLKNLNDLNTATIENTFAIISAKDAEIERLKNEMNNMQVIHAESDDYDGDIKGMKL